jgi:hypothetical protein
VLGTKKHLPLVGPTAGEIKSHIRNCGSGSITKWPPSLSSALSHSGLVPPLAHPVGAWSSGGGLGRLANHGQIEAFLLCFVQRRPSGKSAMPWLAVAFWSFLWCGAAGLRAADRSGAPGWAPFMPWTSWCGPVLPPPKFPGGATKS